MHRNTEKSVLNGKKCGLDTCHVWVKLRAVFEERNSVAKAS